MISFAGPYLSCNARAIAKPSAEERILFHGYTTKHSALDFASRIRRGRGAGVSSLSCAGLPRDLAAASEEPALCATAERARAWRENRWAALVVLERANSM